MDIFYLGHASFKIKGKTATIITDPYDPQMVGLKFPKQQADIVTISHDHPDHNFLDNISDVKRILKGPGEYEIMGVSVIGIKTYHDEKKGAERGKNTIYVYEIDGMRLAHLGDLGHDLSEDLVNEIGNIDILMIPVGGTYTIDADSAANVVREIEPSLVIPMHYKLSGLKEDAFGSLLAVDDFVVSTGLQSEKLDKLALKKGDIPEEGVKIVELTYKA